MTLPADIHAAARQLYDFMAQNEPVIAPDILILGGSTDPSICDDLLPLLAQHAEVPLVISGGNAHHQDLLATGWIDSESRVFANRLLANGVDMSRVLLEERAENTQHNIEYSLALAAASGISVQRALLLHKPFMAQRFLLTARKIAPHVIFGTYAPPIPFDDYVRRAADLQRLVTIMVGDFHRIIEYPRRGFMVAAEIPAATEVAFHHLVAAGYTGHMLKPPGDAA